MVVAAIAVVGMIGVVNQTVGLLPDYMSIIITSKYVSGA